MVIEEKLKIGKKDENIHYKEVYVE